MCAAANSNINIFSIDRDFGISTRPYIVSNELCQEKTYKILSQSKSKEGALHIGFSCWENLNIIAIRNSSAAIIADISNQAFDVMNTTQKFLLESDTREEFLKKILDRFDSSENLADAEWLKTDQDFQKIRSLYSLGRIYHLRMNIIDSKSFEKIAQWMKIHDYFLDSLYLSNIYDWYLNLDDSKEMQKSVGKFKASINRVIQKGTFIIQSSENYPECAGLPQRIFQVTQNVYDPQNLP